MQQLIKHSLLVVM